MAVSSSDSSDDDDDDDDDDAAETGMAITFRIDKTKQELEARCREGETLQTIIQRVCGEHAQLTAKFDGRVVDKSKTPAGLKLEDEDVVLLI